MRILSARILRARRAADTGPISLRVEALVRLQFEQRPGSGPDHVEIAVSAPARAPGAAPLRDRLLAAAKLTFAASASPYRARRAA